MSFRRQIAYNVITQILSKLICISFSVVSVAILARYLGPTDYGNYGLVFAFVSLFAVLADLGLYTVAVREMAQSLQKRDKIFGNVIIFRIFSSLVIFLLAFFVGFVTPYPAVVKWAIGITALGFFFSSIAITLTSVFQVNYRMDIPALVEVLTKGCFLIFVALVVHLKYNLLAIFWFLTLSNFLNIFIYFPARRFIKPKFEFDFVFIKNLLKECMPLGVIAILGSLHLKIGTIILSLNKPAYDVGVYSIAYQVFENLLLVSVVFVTILFPKFAELYRTNRVLLEDVFQKSFDILIIIISPIFILFFAFAPQIIQILAGGQFLNSVLPFRILLLSLSFFALALLFQYLIIVAKNQNWLVRFWGGAAIVEIILAVVLSPKLTYNGIALAVLATGIIVFISSLFLTTRLLNLRIKFVMFKKLLLPLILFIVLCLPFAYVFDSRWLNFQNLSFILQIFWVVCVFVATFACYLWFLLIFKIISFGLIREIVTGKE